MTMALPDRLLLICLAIDAIGLLNVLWGEALDAIWAPVSAVLLRYLFPEQLLFSVLQFVEEMLPLTDFVPTATLGMCGHPAPRSATRVSC